VCACEREREKENVFVCVCVCMRERVCVCVFVREKECVCVCVNAAAFLSQHDEAEHCRRGHCQRRGGTVEKKKVLFVPLFIG